MKKISDLKVKIFADGASLEKIIQLGHLPFIQGLTTNPSLLKQSGVKSYIPFCKQVLQSTLQIPVSFEVFADDVVTMANEATALHQLDPNRVFVKIPVMNSQGRDSYELIEHLAKQKIPLNITAVMTDEQIERCCMALENAGAERAIISIFAGRIADTGRDPIPLMQRALNLIAGKKIEILWASTRELYNIIQADEVGCHIITVTPDIISKFNLMGKNLQQYSMETVQMFFNDVKLGQISWN